MARGYRCTTWNNIPANTGRAFEYTAKVDLCEATVGHPLQYMGAELEFPVPPRWPLPHERHHGGRRRARRHQFDAPRTILPHHFAAPVSGAAGKHSARDDCAVMNAAERCGAGSGGRWTRRGCLPRRLRHCRPRATDAAFRAHRAGFGGDDHGHGRHARVLQGDGRRHSSR